MRWSWPAFVSGAAIGAVLCVALLKGCAEAGDDVVRPAPSEASASPGTRAPPPDAAATPSAAPAVGVALGAATPADTKPGEATAARTRRHAAEPPPEESDDKVVPTTATDAPESSDAPQTFVINNQGGEFTISLSRVRVSATPAHPINPSVAQTLARSRAAATASAQHGDESSARRIEELLASSDDADRELAIGLALAAQPPMTDLLLRIVRDPRYGSLRAAALAGLVEVAAEDSRTADAVAALAADPHQDVARTAVELLPRIGPRGVERAIALLRAGEYAPYVLPALVQTVGASDRALEFVLSRPDPAVAIAVLLAMPRQGPDGSAAAWLAKTAEILRPLLATPEFAANATGLLQLAAAGGQAEFLRAIVTSASSATSLRIAAAAAALGDADLRAHAGASIAATVLGDPRSPDDLVALVLSVLPADLCADPTVRPALSTIASSSPNRWIRELAREKLQLAAPSERGDLVIESAIYGADGKVVDVTRELASRVAGNRLTVEATNVLAGDPNYGVVKVLVVTYLWRGERRTHTVHEGETLTLP